MVQVLDTLLPIHMIIQIYASIGFKPNNEADEIFNQTTNHDNINKFYTKFTQASINP